MYPREQYLNKIISKKDNGRIKIITGLRRSGKSVLLFQLYRDWLIKEGIYEDHIIALALDVLENAKYRNPIELDKYVRDRMVADGEKYYILIDEIQFVSEIELKMAPTTRLKVVDAIAKGLPSQTAGSPFSFGKNFTDDRTQIGSGQCPEPAAPPKKRVP